ncbi:MAG: histidine phosphatase family protein [Gemmatimonadetes bacterium]|nr:histidine phosphatase family protein [Gemmatimonadota bacterium]
MLRLTLVRHGSTALNEQRRYQGAMDAPLSERGREEARRLGGRLRRERFDAVVSSDLVRCTGTAALACAQGAVPDPRLREMDFGRWDGRTYDECLAADGERFRRWIDAPEREAPPGGEAFAHFAARVDAWTDGMPAEGSVLAFAHGGPIRRIIARALGLAWGQVVLMEVSACGITRLVLHPGGGHLVSLNDTAHLEDDD